MLSIYSKAFSIATMTDAAGPEEDVSAAPSRATLAAHRVVSAVYRAVDGVVGRRLRAGRARRHLAALDDHLLDDIGLARADIEVAVGSAAGAPPRSEPAAPAPRAHLRVVC